MPKSSTVVTSLEDLPVICTLKEIAGVYRLAQSTIRKRLQKGVFIPRPFDRYPYRWNRDDIAADLQRKRPEEPPRPHGFAARPRPRPAKATLTPRKRANAAR